jgi:hypothetical protein
MDREHEKKLLVVGVRTAFKIPKEISIVKFMREKILKYNNRNHLGVAKLTDLSDEDLMEALTAD